MQVEFCCILNPKFIRRQLLPLSTKIGYSYLLGFLLRLYIYIYICTNINTYMYTRTHIHTHTYIYIYSYVYIHTYTHIYMQISLNIVDILCLHIFFWIGSNSRITFIVFWGN